MASLISVAERAVLTGIFSSIFDTFQRRIVIYKEPLKVEVPVDQSNFVYGFGDSQKTNAYTYIPVTGVYPATVKYPRRDVSQAYSSSLNLFIPDGHVVIKVKRDCRDFINENKTEKILVDERLFEPVSEEQKQAFLDSEFYLFLLKATK